MRNQKNKWIFKYFFPWQYDEEQNWLEEMAKEGWLLQRVGVGYHFRAAGPQNVIYRIDFVELGGKKLATYRKMFINSGWEYAASNLFGYQYYRIPVKRFSTDIYSDDVPSRIEHLRRIRYSALILAAVSVVIITPYNQGTGYSYILGILLIFGIPAALYAWWAFHIIRKIKLLQREMDERTINWEQKG